jgi:hypothetical protein
VDEKSDEIQGKLEYVIFPLGKAAADHSAAQVGVIALKWKQDPAILMQSLQQVLNFQSLQY